MTKKRNLSCSHIIKIWAVGCCCPALLSITTGKRPLDSATLNDTKPTHRRFYNSPLFLLLYMCHILMNMSTCVSTYVGAWICTHKNARGKCHVFSSKAPPFSFLRQGLPLERENLELTDSTGGAVHWSSIPSIPWPRIQSQHSLA